MLLTPPAVEPVGLNEAKAYLGVLDSAEDNLISNLITAARQAVEQYCGRVLINQSWRLTLDTWPQEAIVNGIEIEKLRWQERECGAHLPAHATHRVSTRCAVILKRTFRQRAIPGREYL